MAGSAAGTEKDRRSPALRGHRPGPQGVAAGIIVAKLNRLSRMPVWKTVRLVEEQIMELAGEVLSASENLRDETRVIPKRIAIELG